MGAFLSYALLLLQLITGTQRALRPPPTVVVYAQPSAQATPDTTVAH
jgi:hypothetical protein